MDLPIFVKCYSIHVTFVSRHIAKYGKMLQTT